MTFFVLSDTATPTVPTSDLLCLIAQNRRESVIIGDIPISSDICSTVIPLADTVLILDQPIVILLVNTEMVKCKDIFFKHHNLHATELSRDHPYCHVPVLKRRGMASILFMLCGFLISAAAQCEEFALMLNLIF
mmetsp:Transcript_28606/g.59600  ORF Transcript_28606/g.59600 Transcript_28606/m.59600 type:complete len:134 (+) Transcript_28606:378-779(+)